MQTKKNSRAVSVPQRTLDRVFWGGYASHTY